MCIRDRNSDTAPWVELRLTRPQKGHVIALTPYLKNPTEPEAWGRPGRVRVFVNRREIGTFDMPNPAEGKLYVELSKRTTVRQVRVEVLSKIPGAEQAHVGLAEIELIDRS